MAGVTTSVDIKQFDPAAVACSQDFACLENPSICKAELFVDRDVQLLRCMDDQACTHRSRYAKNNICNCPVKRASFGMRR